MIHYYMSCCLQSDSGKVKMPSIGAKPIMNYAL